VDLALSVSRQSELLEMFRNINAAFDAVSTYRSYSTFAAACPLVPLRARRLVRQMHTFDADVVVSGMTHLWTPFVAPVLTRARVPFVPVVHDAVPHAGDVALLWDWRLGRELRAASAAAVLSDAVATAIEALRPWLPLIRMRLPTLFLAEPPQPRSSAAGATQFLFFGRLLPYKGLDLLRDAFATVATAHPGAQLRVVGQGDAEACAPGFGSLPGVTIDRRWVPETEIPALIRSADAVVLPYREASQSGVASQALALGVPLVVTPVGGLCEQVIHEQSGLIAATADASALAEVMGRLVDPRLRARLAAGALRAGKALTDWDAEVETLVRSLWTVRRGK
jgi:glycosyltransferase involved in cell wall biosynthesis